jgi:dTDP-4-amino-4,6-dideoxygalactose transaminase
MGSAGAFSFYPGKNMGACGEAGAVTTNDEALAQKVRVLRDHGQTRKYSHDVEGFNGRCDALQAAALRVKLKHLPDWTEKRRENAARYVSFLEDCKQIDLPGLHADCMHVYHLFVIQTAQREYVQKQLMDRGVSTGLHYPVPLHLQAAYNEKGLDKGAFPVTEAYSERLLSLPMYPELTVEQISYVCDNLKDIVERL